jgi:outer membrane protein TolC
MAFRHCLVAVSILIVADTVAFAADVATSPPLPSPLTLEQALNYADEPVPGLLLSQATFEQSQAEQTRAESLMDSQAYFEARARHVNPPGYAVDQSHDDNRYGIVINKDLYDFGKQRAQVDAATYEVDANHLLYLDARVRRRLEITQRYFDVLLADLIVNRSEEEMAVAYVRFDRLRQRKEVGQASDVQVLQAEAQYHRVRVARYQDIAEQRSTRARLAEALNRPDNLPDSLVAPSIKILERKIPDVEELQALLLKQNYQLQALHAKVSAAEQRLMVARAQDNPVLMGSAEAFKYSRELNSNDEMRIGVTLTVPLYEGRRNDAAIAQAQAQLLQARAQLTQTERDLRQLVLRLWLDLDNLRVQREERAVLRKYRELNLDHARALYELDVNADLGDAMALFTDIEYLAAQTDYQMLRTWLQLDILTGQYKLTGTTINQSTSGSVRNHAKP